MKKNEALTEYCNIPENGSEYNKDSLDYSAQIEDLKKEILELKKEIELWKIKSNPVNFISYQKDFIISDVKSKCPSCLQDLSKVSSCMSVNCPFVTKVTC